MLKNKIIKRMKIMRALFLMFVVLVPTGMYLFPNDDYTKLGLVIFLIGGISGIVCAFMKCPCCQKPSGVFFKVIIGGVMPLGICMHCKNSYIKAKGCTKEIAN